MAQPDRPLVAGSSMGPKPRLLHDYLSDLDQTKSSKFSSYTFFQKKVSVLFGLSSRCRAFSTFVFQSVWFLPGVNDITRQTFVEEPCRRVQRERKGRKAG